MTLVSNLRLVPAIAGMVFSGLALAQGDATDPIQLPTGAAMTPLAAPHAVFQTLNPGLSGLTGFTAGQAVTTAMSPDGTKLLILTSGYNQNSDAQGNTIAAQSNEYVFLYDVTVSPPNQLQVLQVPNTFVGLAWSPSGNEFYVTGGVDDAFYIYSLQNSAYAQSTKIRLGHATGNGLLSNAPAPFSAVAPHPMAAGIAVSQSGALAIVANFFNDSVSVIDLVHHVKMGELDLRPGVTDSTKAGVPGGEYPLWAVFKGDTKAYVSSPRDRELAVLQFNGSTPTVAARIPIIGQPNRMVLTKAQTRLYVAADNSDSVSVIDTASDKVVARFSVAAPNKVLPGSDLPKGANPNSVALSPDESTLYVTDGGINAVAVVSLSAAGGQTIGLIPTPWYPNSVSVSADGKTLFVANGKSVPGPNRGDCRGDVQAPGIPDCATVQNQYILQLEKGGLLTLPVPKLAELRGLTEIVARNNHFETVNAGAFNDGYVMQALRNQIQHVIYILKENRTYDQVLGDLEVGNGDPSITEFPEPLTPNHHALARNFVTLDNFFDSGEVSGVGWNWSTAGRTTDFTEKTVPVNYAGRGLTYDWEGTNRNVNVGVAAIADRVKVDPLLNLGGQIPADQNLLPGAVDVAAPDGPAGEAGAGYIWDEALRAGLTVRNYGFYMDLSFYQGSASTNPAYIPISPNPAASGTIQGVSTKAALMPLTDPFFRGFDQANADFYNYRDWAREFDQFVTTGNLPNLSLVRFPHDHFGSFGSANYGLKTPALQMADNDYAVGQLVQHLNEIPYASNTLVFVIEDDAQDGPDHVDAQRSIAYVIGPYVKQSAVVSDHYTTVNMIRTIESVLGLSPSSLAVAGAEPMTEVFDVTQSTWAYNAIVPGILRTSTLPLPAPTARNSLPDSRRVRAYAKDRHNGAWWQKHLGDMDYDEEDKLDTPRFNYELWKGMMGNKPYPTVRGGADLRENRKALLTRFGIE